MSSARDLPKIPPRSTPTEVKPVPPLLGGSGWLAIVLLVAALVFGAALFGCTPSQLAPAKTAATVCNVVETAAPVALYAWESEQEAPIVAAAVASGDADAGHAQLEAQRAKLKPLQAGLDGLDLVCTSLSKAVKIAEQQGGGASIADEVVGAVLSQVVKVVKLLLDAGVNIPPRVLQLVQAA